jgi:hypothetical protein
MTPKEYAAIIKNKAKYGSVYVQQYECGLAICRGITLGEFEAIRTTTATLKVSNILLAQAVFELTCVYPENTDNVPFKVATMLGNNILDDIRNENAEDVDELNVIEEELSESEYPTFYYKLMQSLPVSVSMRISAQKNKPQNSEYKNRKGIFIEN